jgi:uncharacterized membrane protein YhhN
MYYHLLPVPLSILGIIIYNKARKENNLKQVAFIQPVGTVIAVFIASLSALTPGFHPGFTLFIIASLLLALIGDINNIDMMDERTVLVGLVIFVFAYLTYAAGFTVYSGFQKEDMVIGAIMFLIYMGVMAYLWPGLGEMKVPVLIYTLVMPFMVTRAISTFFGDFFSQTQCILLTIGTVMLYLGDLEFGIHRFKKPIPMTFGPFLYAGGQLVISLSPSYFPAP